MVGSDFFQYFFPPTSNILGILSTQQKTNMNDDELSWSKVEVAGNGFEMEETGFYDLEEVDGNSVDVVKDANGMWTIVPKSIQVDGANAGADADEASSSTTDVSSDLLSRHLLYYPLKSCWW